MTRKHFQLIADVIREASMPLLYKKALAASMAYALASTNPAFNRSRFLAACGAE